MQAMQEDQQEPSEQEQKRLLKLGNLVLVDYVRSMVDLLIEQIEEFNQEL